VPRRRQVRELGTSESDAERERVVAVLRHHYAAGRLTLEDFTERIDRAYSAGTMDELEATTRGLAAGPLALESRGPLATALRHEGFLIPAAVFGVIETVLIAAWVVAGAGYFWPIWPALVILLVLSLILIGLTAEAAQHRRRRLPSGEA
jgi:uncharacterized membrane protein